MKHASLFDEFLNDVVNLNATRVSELEKSIDAIKATVASSNYAPKIQSWMAQGSWAHKTIIKPVDQGEFDADLVMFIYPEKGWMASQYIETLYDALRANSTYRDKVRRWSHCVTITYANERKIDITPCIVNRNGLTRFEVCNRNSDEFELSEPKQYTDWIRERNKYSGGNSFRKLTRLVKYLRDIKTTFTCPSVLLTTLLGFFISSADQNGNDFVDTPTALKTVFGRLDNWLQAQTIKPIVPNPTLSSENFADLWTSEQYSNFRDMINKYREWIDDAFNEPDRNESIAKWRRVFGDDFASDVVTETAKGVSKSVVSHLKESGQAAASFVGDLVDAIRLYGAQILPTRFDKQPHMRSPRWRRLPSPAFSVRIKANLYQSKGYNLLKENVRSLEPLSAGYWLEFTAMTGNGLPISTQDFRVEWRVTNTDVAAADARHLRGDFYRSESGQSRFESLKYRGVHLVEAFVVRKRDEILVAVSDPFYVLIE